MNPDELLRRFEKLAPRSKELVLKAIERPELRLTDVAVLIGMGQGTMRDRIKKVYAGLDCDGRVDLHARLAPLLQASGLVEP
ncbi:MAG: hypothetical protein ABL886_00980 [Rhodoglobus sp.]